MAHPAIGVTSPGWILPLNVSVGRCDRPSGARKHLQKVSRKSSERVHRVPLTYCFKRSSTFILAASKLHRRARPSRAGSKAATSRLRKPGRGSNGVPRDFLDGVCLHRTIAGGVRPFPHSGGG